MGNSFRFRLQMLAIAMMGLLGVIGVLAHQAWNQLRQVQAHFDIVEGESTELAAAVSMRAQMLHATLLRAKLSGQATDEEAFRRRTTETLAWLQNESEQMSGESERNLLLAIRTRLEAYLEAANAFIGGEPISQPSDPAALAGQVEELTNDVESVQAMALGLAKVHAERLDAVFADAEEAVRSIQWIILVALSLLLAAGATAGWIVFREWIAPLQRELIQSREQLQRHEKLASLGVLSAGVAHEIRNPLTAVKARLHTIRKAVAQDPSALDDVTVVGGEVDRLERIVRTFLRLARPPDPNRQSVDTTALLNHVRELTAPQWAEKQIEVEVDADGAPAISADREQIEQVLLNLVQNAAEAMPDGGRVVLRARPNVGPAKSTRDPMVEIEVSDTGVGMTKEVQARLFDPFFSTKSAGTGLGLALSAGIVEKHGGLIRFDSTLGRGTTFSIRLPAADRS